MEDERGERNTWNKVHTVDDILVKLQVYQTVGYYVVIRCVRLSVYVC